MLLKFNYKQTFIILLIIIFFVIIVYFLAKRIQVPEALVNGIPEHKISQDSDSGSADIFNSKWSEQIVKNGAEASYQDFLVAYRGASPDEQHTEAHLFGDALYTVTGLAGIAVCDQHFNFGCYHEFLGKAIQDKGLEVVSLLNDECIDSLHENFLGCQHGIGHGVLGYIGYTDTALRKSLEICHKLRAQPQVSGCLGGVFMEYNLQTMLGNEGRTRLFDETLGYHYPCNVLESQFQDACYYEQPQWWQALYSNDWNIKEKRDEMFQKMGKRCEEIVGKSLQQRCYRGIGNNAPSVVKWNIEEMISICRKMPNIDAEVECRAAAAGAFFVQDTSWGVCRGLSESHYSRCIETAQSPR